MLFHPREPKKILGITFQGVFPKRQAHVAEKIGELVANELLASDDILMKINSAENIANIIEKLDKRLNHYFEVDFIEKYPIMSKLLPEKLKYKLQKEILVEVENLTPELLETQIKYLEQRLDIKALISKRVNMLSSEKLEAVIWNILSKEFQFIEWVGAILGFLIGLLQLALSLLIL